VQVCQGVKRNASDLISDWISHCPISVSA